MDIKLAREDTYCVRSRVLDPETQKAGRVSKQIAGEYYLGSANVAAGEVASGGGFEVCGLPAGTYGLIASPIEREQQPHYASESFTIGDRSLRLPDLLLRPLIRFSGRVMVDAPSESGIKPFPRPVHISLTGFGRPFVADEKREAQVNKPGAFVIPAVLPAEYWLTVRPPGGSYLKSATVGGRDALRQPSGASGQFTISAFAARCLPAPHSGRRRLG
jgi:hypothetical protein